MLQIFEELHDFSDDLQYLLVAAVANQDDICGNNIIMLLLLCQNSILTK